MELILKEDVVNLGYKNDIVTVKSGYGRNYLIPTGKAVIASPAAKKMLAEELKQRAHKLEKIKKDAEAVAETLKGVSLTIATKVSATGVIYGSVGNIQIADELAKLGHNIDRKIIVVKDTVKEVGQYKAIIKLQQGSFCRNSFRSCCRRSLICICKYFNKSPEWTTVCFGFLFLFGGVELDKKLDMEFGFLLSWFVRDKV